MSRKIPLTLSLVIPVYNEEHHIRRCLESVASQVTPFNEVIVVDNNCTDNTIAIAREFPFVKIVKEKKQGLIAARDTGFHEAKGNIIGRIDADAELLPNWTQIVLQRFENPLVSGVTGPALTSLLPRVKKPQTILHSLGYFWGVGIVFRTQVLWGANMAVRRSAWLKVRHLTHKDDAQVHEDQDLSLCLLAGGGKITLENKLLMVTHGQAYHYFPKFLEYCQRALKTKRIHKKEGRIPVSKAVRIPFYGLVGRWVIVGTIGLIFAITSLLFWPIDIFMLKFGREKTWLH